MNRCCFAPYVLMLVLPVPACFGSGEIERIIWENPAGRVDLARGPGGNRLPAPPYRFLKELTTGSSPKMTVEDANGRVWRVKFGNEVNAEVFGSRIAWAAGYYADACYFVRFGHVEGVRNPQRIASHLKDGHFRNACFSLNG